jgi:hypothetical protein
MALQILYRVLALSTNSFHLLSWARVFQFGTFVFCISFLTSSPQRVFGSHIIPPIELGLQEQILGNCISPCPQAEGTVETYSVVTSK